MTEDEKVKIQTLRSAGYSYGEIAAMLGKARSTVSSFCLRHEIEAPDQDILAALATKRYKVCLKCGKLFMIGNNPNKQFCSDNCRVSYWQVEKDNKRALEKDEKDHRALMKELDFFGKKSDEWCGSSTPVLYRITEANRKEE
ncbi:helix-turn-helix domain-containing protein [Candidatus Saccharibacteria bacterium]|nr:helix-turn-helix domain-containing protein [Candidatus Saccharibacteria bacterium]